MFKIVSDEQKTKVVCWYSVNFYWFLDINFKLWFNSKKKKEGKIKNYFDLHYTARPLGQTCMKVGNIDCTNFLKNKLKDRPCIGIKLRSPMYRDHCSPIHPSCADGLARRKTNRYRTKMSRHGMRSKRYAKRPRKARWAFASYHWTAVAVQWRKLLHACADPCLCNGIDTNKLYYLPPPTPSPPLPTPLSAQSPPPPPPLVRESWYKGQDFYFFVWNKRKICPYSRRKSKLFTRTV